MKGEYAIIYERDIEINYYDLDGRGDMKLTALLKYINLSAVANADELGISYEKIAALGLAFVIQRFTLRISRWPVINQTVTIKTWPAEITKGTFRRNGSMHDKDGNKIAEWTGLWVLIDIIKRRVQRPKALPVPLPAYGLMDVDFEAAKLEIPEDAGLTASYRHIVRFSEIDLNMHMNNAVYGDLIANLLEISESPMPPVTKWREVSFNYLTETVLGDSIEVQCRQSGQIIYIYGTVKGQMVFTSSVKYDEGEE